MHSCKRIRQAGDCSEIRGIEGKELLAEHAAACTKLREFAARFQTADVIVLGVADHNDVSAVTRTEIVAKVLRSRFRSARTL